MPCSLFQRIAYELKLCLNIHPCANLSTATISSKIAWLSHPAQIINLPRCRLPIENHLFCAQRPACLSLCPLALSGWAKCHVVFLTQRMRVHVCAGACHLTFWQIEKPDDFEIDSKHFTCQKPFKFNLICPALLPSLLR